MESLAIAWSQLRPPKPTLTEENIPDLQGKIYIVTGANTGIGKELAQILYSKNAKVYAAARSEEKAAQAIEAIKAAVPVSKGELVFLKLDLSDLSATKACANEFLAKESKLHVLFNNAGVMTPPQGSKSAQGYELQLGTNNVGTFLLTKLLTPTLAATAKSEPPSAVRVVWVSSSAAETFSHKPGGVDVSNLDYHKDKSAPHKYGVSKAGNYLHAAEYARRHSESDGIVSVALNPGNLVTDLARHQIFLVQKALQYSIQYPPVYGAYTELWAGFSPEVTVEKTKAENYWIVPWGRYLPMRKDIVASTKPKSEGGTGVGQEFWEWTERQVEPFV